MPRVARHQASSTNLYEACRQRTENTRLLEETARLERLNDALLRTNASLEKELETLRFEKQKEEDSPCLCWLVRERPRPCVCVCHGSAFPTRLLFSAEFFSHPFQTCLEDHRQEGTVEEGAEHAKVPPPRSNAGVVTNLGDDGPPSFSGGTGSSDHRSRTRGDTGSFGMRVATTRLWSVIPCDAADSVLLASAETLHLT